MVFGALFAISLISHATNLEAGGWGKTKETFQYEGATWDGVYFDMNGLNLQAFIPNYSGAALQNGEVSINGSVNEEIGYLIATSFNSNFTPPKTAKQFVKMIQDANPSHVINVVDSKKLKAKYAVDLIPKNQNDTAFWRFISTNNRLIKMGTDDTNGNRRLYFFESLSIR
jgi:hypothetical protein